MKIVRGSKEVPDDDDLGSVSLLITSPPLISLYDAWRREFSVLMVACPGADATAMLLRNLSQLRASLTAADETEAWIPVHKAAGRLGLTPQAVTSRCRRGVLKSKKVGGLWFVYSSSLQEAA